MRLTVIVEGSDRVAVVAVAADTEVLLVKLQLEDSLGIDAARQALVLYGRELRDAETVGAASLSDGDMLSLQVRGGAPAAPPADVVNVAWSEAADMSQFDLPDGRSACTMIALEACATVLSFLPVPRDGLRDAVSATLLTGEEAYRQLALTGSGVEHLSAEEAVALSDRLRAKVTPRGTLQGRTKGGDAFVGEMREVQRSARAGVPACAIVTK